MKKQKGAITLYVAVICLFVLTVGIIAYVGTSSRQAAQLAALKKIEEAYNNTELTANDLYQKYDGGDIVPIFTPEQFSLVGSGEDVYVEQTGKFYTFSIDKTYMFYGVAEDLDLLMSELKEEIKQEVKVEIGTGGGSGSTDLGTVKVGVLTLTKNTNQLANAVTITATASSENGIITYVMPDRTEKIYENGTTEISETYTVTANGTYTFKVVEGDGTISDAEIIITNVVANDIGMKLSTENWTNQDVNVTITWPDGSEAGVKEIKIDEGEWTRYIGLTTNVTCTENCTVYARVTNGSDDMKTNSVTISKIDKIPPVITLVEEGTATIPYGESHDFSSFFEITDGGGAPLTKTYWENTGITGKEKNWNNTNQMYPGTHVINSKIVEETGVTVTLTKTILIEEPTVIANIEEPNLIEGMVAVYWSTDGGATASSYQEGATEIYSKIDANGKPSSTGTENSNFNWDNWYAYTEGNNFAETRVSRWANAVTDDGSYWVWIPRYKYLISDKPTTAGNTYAGKVDVKFITTAEKAGADGYTVVTNSEGEILTQDVDGYIIHPAFEDGSSAGKNNIFANGEWDSELAGFWVAKYEMSQESSSDSGVTWSNVNTSSSSYGNKLTTNAGNSSYVRLVSKPGVRSWRYVTIGNMYTNCLAYDISINEAMDSHLMKNSEWGAVAYLTHSQYGRNRNEITINDSSGYYTGNAGSSTTDSSTQSSIENAYNTEKGMLASTTANIYGVYDMSGGAWEYTAGWDTKASSLSYGSVFASTGGSSTKYATAYSNGTSTSSGSTVSTVCRTGDGIKETWVTGSSSWYSDYSYFVYSSYPFSTRGGYYHDGASAGVFYSYRIIGFAYSDYSFRAVLACGG